MPCLLLNLTVLFALVILTYITNKTKDRIMWYTLLYSEQCTDKLIIYAKAAEVIKHTDVSMFVSSIQLVEMK